MSNMDIFAEEREQAILKLLKDKKRITVPELVKTFNISGTTIRKQLNDLEKDGRLIRTHGGAISFDEATFEESVETKSIYRTAEKKAIAAEARKFVNNGDVLMLGGGTTVLEFARQLHDARDLIVITNSIPTAVELYTNKNIEVQICGGTIRDKTGVVVGSRSEAFIGELFAGKTFVGADSISLEYGLTTPNSFEAQIEKQLILHGKSVFVLADHSKMDKVTMAKQATLREINYIITDCHAKTDFIGKLRSTGVEVILAQMI